MNPLEKGNLVQRIDVWDDPFTTLKEWQTFIEDLIETYGEDSIMFTDSGHNNTSMVVEVKGQP